MTKLSAADMFALSQRGSVSNFPENQISKRNNTVSKMVTKAVAAVSVMLATQLETKAEDENSSAIDDTQTGSLGSSPALTASEFQNVPETIETAAQNTQSQVASLANPAPASGNATLGSVTNNSFASETGLPRDSVTQSIGVSDPAQQTREVPIEFPVFERGQTIINTGSISSTSPLSVIEGIDGQDGADGQDGRDGIDGQNGANGADGQDGRDGIDGQNGANGTNGQDGRDGIDGQNGANGTDGQDGRDGINGQNGANGTDGQDGIDGLSTVYLDGSLFTDTEILDLLRDNGFDVQEGPLGSIVISFDPSRADELVNLLDSFASSGNETSDENTSEPEHGTTSTTGTDQDDFLSGDESDNVISGFGGNDHLSGGTGADTLLGGDGVDTADYRASLEGVHVDLETREALFGDAEGDILVSIENLAGGSGDDILTGDAGNNRLTGRDGDDILSGGEGNDRLIGGEGADQFIGGAGNRDAADFNLAEEAVGVDLLNGGFMGEADGDTYQGIEFIVGSAYHDILLGNNDNNRINGGDGCDVLNGRDGNDTLIGEAGDDIINGGEGADVFIFGEDTGYDIIEDFEAGEGRTDRIQFDHLEFDSFEDIQDAMIETDDGVILTSDNGTILFQGLDIADFHADDFIFAHSAF